MFHAFYPIKLIKKYELKSVLFKIMQKCNTGLFLWSIKDGRLFRKKNFSRTNFEKFIFKKFLFCAKKHIQKMFQNDVITPLHVLRLILKLLAFKGIIATQNHC